MGSSYLRHFQTQSCSSDYVEDVASRYAILIEHFLARPANAAPLNEVNGDGNGRDDHRRDSCTNGDGDGTPVRGGGPVAVDYFNDAASHRYQHENGGHVAEKLLNLHVLSLAVNPSSFGAFNCARQLTLKYGELLKFCSPERRPATTPTVGNHQRKGGLAEEANEDILSCDQDVPVAKQTYRMVSVGLHCLQTLLSEISDKSPTVCTSALNSLLHLLGALPPEALALEPKDFVAGLYRLLLDLRSSPCEEIATTSSSCLLALAVAYGVPEFLLETASLYLSTILNSSDDRRHLLRDRICIRIPENFYALQQLAFKHITGFSYADSSWSRCPLTTSNIVASYCLSPSHQAFSTSSSDDIKPKYAAIAHDGRFLYLLNGDGLYKLGTGLGETKLGSIYARNSQLKATSDSWLACCNNVVYLRRQHSTKVFVLDNDTLLDVGEILLSPLVAQGLLCSDGSSFYLFTVQESSKTLTLTTMNDCFATMDDDQLRFPLTESKLLVLGDHHPCVTAADLTSKFDSRPDEITYIKVVREAALLLDKSGRVYAGSAGAGRPRPQTSADLTSDSAVAQWMEIPAPEPVGNIVPSADGLSVLLLCPSGQAYFAGSEMLKTSRAAAAAKKGAVKSQQQPVKFYPQRPQRVSAPNNRRIIGGACSDGTVILLTENGRLFVAGLGKQAPYSNPDTGQVFGLEHVHVAQVAMGKTHTVAVTRHGHVYTFGANHLGQCGRAELATVRGAAAAGDSDSDRSKTDDDVASRGDTSSLAPIGWSTGYTAAPVRLCAPSDHIWLRETATVCTACGFCSSRGSVCPNAKDKPKGTACGCGPGLSGCAKCGVCRSCGKQYHRASGSERDSEGESVGAPYPQLVPAKLTLRPVGDCRAAEVSCGNYHTIVRTTDGHVVTFGNNRHGQLGVGDVKSRLGPQFVLLPTSVVAAQVAAGANHCVVRTTEGLVYTFGKHHNGQLGRDGRSSTAWFAAPGLVEGFGADARKAATWVSAGCDVTLIIYEQNLFTSSTLSTACITANHSTFAIFPKSMKRDRGCYFVMKRLKEDQVQQQPKVTKLRIESNDGKLNAVWSLDPHYNTFWSYCVDSGSVCCHVPASKVHFAHPLSYLQNLDYWIPLKHQPVAESQVGVSLLACYYSLSAFRFHLFGYNDLSLNGDQAEDTSMAGVKEGCLEVCRFQSFGGGWGYSLQSVEAIQFCAAKDVWILGYGLFGGRGEYLAQIKLLKPVTSGGDDEKGVETMAETDEVLYECSPKEKRHVYFARPIMCKAGRWYVAWASINGPSSDCGAGGMTTVRTEEDVTFHFRTSRLSNNGTDVHVGQIPSILYATAQLVHSEKHTNDGLNASSNCASLMDKPLTGRFFLALTPRYITILVDLLSKASNVLFSLPSASATRKALSSTKTSDSLLSELKIRDWECERASSVVVFCIRMLSVAVTMVYPKNRPPSGVERQEFVPAIGECSELVLRILDNDAASNCELAKRVALGECRAFLLDFFHLFFPTSSSICTYMQSLMKSANQGCWSINTFLTALSHLETPVTCLFSPNCSDAVPVLHPLLAAHVQKVRKAKGKVYLEFLSVTHFLMDLIFDARESHEAMDQYEASAAAVDLLVRLIADLVYGTGNESGENDGITTRSLPTLFQTPKRFGRLSTTTSWDTGGGSPDAIAFQVDRNGVSVHGAGVYTGFGNFTYSLELLVNQGDHISEKWLTLEKISGTVDTRDCVNDIAYVKLHKPVKLEPHSMYAFRLRMNGGRTWNGECGVASVCGYKGVRFTYYPCTQSLNGTTVNRGQIPAILYSLATNSHSTTCAESIPCVKWILTLTKGLVTRLESALRLVSLEKGVEEDVEERKYALLHRMVQLVPRFFGYLSILVERNPLTTFDVASSLDELLMTLFTINSNRRSRKEDQHDAQSASAPGHHSAQSTSPPGHHDAKLTSPGHQEDQIASSGSPNLERVERIAIESDHPYKPCKVYSYVARFDLSVTYMTLEFDANCCTAQSDDSLQLYVTSPDGQFYPVAKLFGGSRNWPKSVLLLPGNCVWFILETASNYAKEGPTSMYGFKCLVTGYAGQVQEDALSLLESELVNLCAYCCRQIIEKNYHFVQVQSVGSGASGGLLLHDQVDVRILEEETDDMVRDHLLLLRKGMHLDHTPNVHELIAGKLPLKRVSPELRFLRDFINAASTTAGGKLARWLMPEPYVDPFHCEMSLDLENLRSGQSAVVTIVTKDQYDRIVFATNAIVEVFVGSVTSHEKSSSKDDQDHGDEYPDYARTSQSANAMAVEINYQPTYLNKARYISITMMKQQQRWSFEELRLLHFRETVSKESLHVLSSRDGTYAATWTPKQSGFYRVECRVDGISISQIHNVEVSNGQIVNRKHSRRTAYLSRARMATVYKDDTQGVRIRTAPSLQAPQMGLLPAGATVFYVDECENGDGVWLRLNDESAVMFCTKVTNPFQAWCLQFHGHLRKTLIFRDSDIPAHEAARTTTSLPINQDAQSVIVACEDEYIVKKLETTKGAPVRAQAQKEARIVAHLGLNDVVQSNGWVHNADGEVWVHVILDAKAATKMKQSSSVTVLEGYCLVQEPGGVSYLECCLSPHSSRTSSVYGIHQQQSLKWESGNITNGNAGPSHSRHPGSSFRQSSTQTSPGDQQRKNSIGEKLSRPSSSQSSVVKSKPVVKVPPQNASVLANRPKGPVLSAMSPSIADSVRSVFAALMWHEQIVHDAMACAAYLKFHPALQRTQFRPEVMDGHLNGTNTDGFQSNIPIGLQMLQSLWKEVYVAIQTVIEKHWILPSPPMAVKTPDQRPFGSSMAQIHQNQQESIQQQQLQFCELCEGWFPQTVTLHMHSAHPGCGSHAGGQGYNSLGRYTGGWTGNCGDCGVGSSPWYLLCYRCRANYLQTTGTQKQRQRRDKARLFRISTGNVDPQRILKNNAMFLLELNMKDDDESFSTKSGFSMEEGDSDIGPGGSSTARTKTRPPVQPSKQSDWVVNLFPRQIASTSSDESNELRSRESMQYGQTGEGAVGMEMNAPYLDGHTFASDPGPKLPKTDDEVSLPSSEPSIGQQPVSVARRARTSSIMVPGSSDFQCLASPSHALQAAVRLDTTNASVQSTLRRPTIAFSIQHHDLSHVQISMRLAVIRTVLLEYAFQVFVWLLRNATNPASVMDVLLHFVTAMAHLKPPPPHQPPQAVFGPDKTLVHPLKLTLLAGGIRQGVVRQFHIFLQTIATMLRHHEGVSFDALRACLRSFMFQFTTHDQDLILKSRILSTLSSIMSDRRDESSSLTNVFSRGIHASMRSTSSAELESLVDLTHQSTVEVASRRAMVPSLLDGTTETFWESGDEEKGKTKVLTVTWTSESNSLPVLLSIYIDNCQDQRYRTSQVCFTAIVNGEPRKRLKIQTLETQFVGWVKCYVALYGAIRIELKSPDPYVRVRQLSLTGYVKREVAETGEQQAVMMKHSPSIIMQFDAVQTDAFDLFQLLASNAFGEKVAGAAVTAAGPGQNLQQQVLNILFSRNQMHALQNYVSSQMVNALEREILLLRDKLKRNYSYCCGLMTMLSRVISSPSGRQSILSKSALLSSLSELPLFSSPIVQCQALETIEKMISVIDTKRTNADVLVENLLILITKALTLQIRQRPSQASKTVTAAAVLLEEGRLLKWHVYRSTSIEIAQFATKLLTEMATGEKFGPAWSMAVKTSVANQISCLALLSTDLRDSTPAAKEAPFWLAAGALCVCQHQEWLQYSPAWRSLMSKVSVETTICENHDDGRTMAVIYCEQCKLYMCADCSSVLHLNRKSRMHVMQQLTTADAQVQVIVHETCSRLKLNWLLLSVDRSTMNGMAEFRSTDALIRVSTQRSTSLITGSKRCRFCDAPTLSELHDTCARVECQDLLAAACHRTLQCGHTCGGVVNEQECPPCLKCHDPSLKQDSDDMCVICFTETLSAAPIVRLSCTHVFHHHCCRTTLSRRWPGPRITFGFMSCPICKAPMDHPALQDLLDTLIELRDDVKRKATVRLQYDGLAQCSQLMLPGGPYFNDPASFAMDRYAYYLCHRCQKPYFGGEAHCQQLNSSNDYNPTELVCGGCSDVSRAQICPRHGITYLEYKCRYCCSIAVFFCFGTTHFCAACHDDFQRLIAIPRDQLPPCPAGPRAVSLDPNDQCPLKVTHPPTGEEFALGCGICRNLSTF